MAALTPRQQALLDQWLPGATIERDHSWGLVGTTVLELRAPDGASYILKAGDEHDHHLARELTAHQQWLDVWAATGHAPRLVNGSAEAKLLLTEHLPGELVEGTDHERSPDAYRQAGALLARFHAQQATVDNGEFEAAQKHSVLAWLSGPHRIAKDAVTRLTREIEAWSTSPSVVVPTHGDWQPRNWLVDRGTVRVIDFGRTALRPAHTDFGRLAAQQFLTTPALETAFLAGYGPDPRRPDAWRRLRVQEAIGTAAWAYKVGEESFERQGHRMIAAVLDDH